jgi:hypothetical protein
LLLPPCHGRQRGDRRETEQVPVGLTTLIRDEEAAMGVLPTPSAISASRACVNSSGETDAAVNPRGLQDLQVHRSDALKQLVACTRKFSTDQKPD